MSAEEWFNGFVKEYLENIREEVRSQGERHHQDLRAVETEFKDLNKRLTVIEALSPQHEKLISALESTTVKQRERLDKHETYWQRLMAAAGLGGLFGGGATSAFWDWFRG